MSEVCKNCPISVKDPEAPILCAAAARSAELPRPDSTAFNYSSAPATPEELIEMDRIDTYEGVDTTLDTMGFSPRRIRQAMKCAQKIKWDECDFKKLDQISE